MPRSDTPAILRKAVRRGAAFALTAALLSSCAYNPGDTRNLKQHGSQNQVRILSKEQSDRNQAGPHTLQVRTIHNTDYVSLPELAKATGYLGMWLSDNKSFGMGDHDPAWVWKQGSSVVKIQGNDVRMAAPAVRDNGHLLVPVSSLSDMFGQAAAFSTKSAVGITVLPQPLMSVRGMSDGRTLAFSDAPDRITALSASGSPAQWVAYAKQFLGVPYLFGAAPYSSSRRFDCSTFVQTVFGRFGVSMPRVAAQQAQRGTPVSRDALRVGDLLFFNVPGRFKSSRQVGHVGIYIGNGQMIHASPAGGKGVQITNINKAWYVTNFLFAKRVLS